MKRALILIFCAYLVDVIYTLVEWDFTKQYSFFPFFHGHAGWDGKMALGSYVYYLCQHVSIMMILNAAYQLTIGRLFGYLFWIEFTDLLDYVLCYHEAWFMVYGWEFEWNYGKIFLVAFVTYNEWKKLKYTGSLE